MADCDSKIDKLRMNAKNESEEIKLNLMKNLKLPCIVVIQKGDDGVSKVVKIINHNDINNLKEILKSI